MRIFEDIMDDIDMSELQDDNREIDNNSQYNPHNVKVIYEAEKTIQIMTENYEESFKKISAFIKHFIKFITRHPSCSDTEILSLDLWFGIPASNIGFKPLLHYFPKLFFGHELTVHTTAATSRENRKRGDIDVKLVSKFNSIIDLESPVDFIQFYDNMLLPDRGFKGDIEFMHTVKPRYYKLIGEFADEDDLDADWPVWIDFNDDEHSWLAKVLCYLFSNEKSVNRLKEVVKRRNITYLMDIIDLKFNWDYHD